MKDYPNIKPKDLQEVIELLLYILKERPNDIKDFQNVKNNFMSGRKVGTIPTGAATVSSDRIGDFNFDQDNFYIVVDNLGVAEWRKLPFTPW